MEPLIDDEALTAWVGRQLRARHPDLPPGLATAFADSDELRHLIAVFKNNLGATLDKFSTAHAATLVPPAPPPDLAPLPELAPLPGLAPLPDPAPAAAPALAAPPAPTPGTATASASPVVPMHFPDLNPTPPAEDPQPDMTPLAINFRLPNARAGDAYASKLQCLDLPDERIVLGPITIPDGLALAYDSASGLLSGKPAGAGEYDIGVHYRLDTELPDQQRLALVKLTVNPDPKSLWKNLPSDTAGPYWRPDQACASLRGPEMRIIAASKRGRSHAHVGSFRDDDFQIDIVPDSGWYIAVVADGAGSARFSREGAALICNVAKERLRAALGGAAAGAIDAAARAAHLASLDRAGVKAGAEADGTADSKAGAELGANPPAQPRLDGDTAETAATAQQKLRNVLCGVVGNAAYYATKAIIDECGKREADLQAAFKDYSSTALIAICKRYAFGTLCAAYWVGDGAIGVYSKKHGVTLLGDVDSGEYSGQTRFLESSEITQEALLKRTRYAIVEDMTALVLMSDGVSDPQFETEARLARAADWDALWNDLDQAVGLSDDGDAATPAPEEKLLAWLDFWSQGNHDDRTIAIIQ